jgi:hypothetical protein
MSIDSARFVNVAKTAIREQVADLLRALPSTDRAAYLEEEAQSLAYAFAEMAEERTQELRASLRLDDLAALPAND